MQALSRNVARIGLAGLTVLCLGAGAVLAQTAAPTANQPPTNPAGVGQQSWSPAVTPAPRVAGLTLDDKQIEALKKVSIYFNDLKQLKGSFIQTNADAKRLRGKFYVKQPGRFRFDYGSGSKMVIISDGTYLAIQDHDLKTDDRIELDRTPFRMLLRKDVDLLRDANVTEVQEVEDLIIVALADKSPDAPGRIKLFMTKKPLIELKEWVTTDAQGIDTRVEVSELNRTDEVDNGLFKPPPIALQRQQ